MREPDAPMLSAGFMKRFRLIRYAIYVLVIAVLFLARGTSVMDKWNERLFPSEDGALVLSGTLLAPTLIQNLTDAYQRDYPELELVGLGGGTARALQDLLDGTADIAFLIRPPNSLEHEIFRDATGDTIDYHVIALGAVAFVRNSTSPRSQLRPQELRALLRGQSPDHMDRIYAPDPNSGLWDALGSRLWKNDEIPERIDNVVFVADEEQVIEAILRDPGAVGVVSTLHTNPTELPPELKILALRTESDELARMPFLEEIADGSYPLHHYLYAGLREGGDVQARKFITYLTSDSGQRGIERAGFLPQRRVLREVHLSKKAIGE